MYLRTLDTQSVSNIEDNFTLAQLDGDITSDIVLNLYDKQYNSGVTYIDSYDTNTTFVSSTDTNVTY